MRVGETCIKLITARAEWGERSSPATHHAFGCADKQECIEILGLELAERLRTFAEPSRSTAVLPMIAYLRTEAPAEGGSALRACESNMTTRVIISDAGFKSETLRVTFSNMMPAGIQRPCSRAGINLQLGKSILHPEGNTYTKPRPPRHKQLRLLTPPFANGILQKQPK